MNFMKVIGTTKPSQYETVEDAKDLRIPVQNEEAFEHGISFKCKYIGTEEIPRPTSRVEIVAAMRRIRYEHKYRNVKKRKVFLDISADGIKVTLRKKKKKNMHYDERSLFIMHYPINRVFYVSHDSQDLKILSYIARGDDGIFKCSVYKALKKSQAMHVVRTIGQAFEVCHKINTEKGIVGTKEEAAVDEAGKETEVETEGDEVIKDPEETDIDDVAESDIDSPSIRSETVELIRPVSTLVTDIDAARDLKNLPPPLVPGLINNTPPPVVQIPVLVNGELGDKKHGPFTLQQLQQLYHQQLLQQIQEADTARNELTRVRSQLKVETDARSQAQTQVHRLLAQNRELIVMVQKLMSQVQDKFANEFLQPVNETWMLSDLSSTVYSSIGMFPQESCVGLGTSNTDFDSKIFDNCNTGFSPSHLQINSSTVDSFFSDTKINNNNNITNNNNNNNISGLSHNQVVDYNSLNSSTKDSNNSNFSTSTQRETNPFVPQLTGTEMYQSAFDTSVQTSINSTKPTNETLPLGVS